MAIQVSRVLFVKPGEEFGAEGDEVTAAELREWAGGLHGRLLRAADDLGRLEADGWACVMALYELLCWHPDVATEAEAQARLRGLGLDPEDFGIEEGEGDEEDEGD